MNDRMLKLLETISSLGSSAPPREVAQEADLPLATAYRLLDQMQKLGVIQKVGPGFEIGDRLTRVVLAATPEEKLRHAIMPDLQELADETGSTVFAARLAGNDINLFLRVMANSGSVGGVLPPLGARPAICSAAKAIYVHLPEDQRTKVIEAANAKFPNLSIPNGRVLKSEVESTLETAFATCFGDEDPDIGSFATAVPLQNKLGFLSIGIVGTRTNIEKTWYETRDKVRRCAEHISDRVALTV